MNEGMEFKDLKLDIIQLRFSHVFFTMQFFEDNPQCKGCERVEKRVMDYQLYPAVEENYCKTCDKYRWG